MQAGEEFGAVPYGTEALGVLRIEKGRATGNEINGQTTAENLGMGRMVSRKKDCIGNVLSQRPEMVAEDGLRLVGIRPVDRSRKLIAGAHFVTRGDPVDTAHDQGWVTSVAWSPTLGQSLGLGIQKRGQDRLGETVRAESPIHDTEIEVEVVSPHFIDPDGGRQRD